MNTVGRAKLGFDRAVFLVGLPGTIGAVVQAVRGAPISPVLLAAAGAVVILWAVLAAVDALLPADRTDRWFESADKALPAWWMYGTFGGYAGFMCVACGLGAISVLLYLLTNDPATCQSASNGCIAGLTDPSKPLGDTDGKLFVTTAQLAWLSVKAAGGWVILGALVALFLVPSGAARQRDSASEPAVGRTSSAGRASVEQVIVFCPFCGQKNRVPSDAHMVKCGRCTSEFDVSRILS